MLKGVIVVVIPADKELIVEIELLGEEITNREQHILSLKYI